MWTWRQYSDLKIVHNINRIWHEHLCSNVTSCHDVRLIMERSVMIKEITGWIEYTRCQKKESKSNKKKKGKRLSDKLIRQMLIVCLDGRRIKAVKS